MDRFHKPTIWYTIKTMMRWWFHPSFPYLIWKFSKVFVTCLEISFHLLYANVGLITQRFWSENAFKIRIMIFKLIPFSLSLCVWSMKWSNLSKPLLEGEFASLVDECFNQNHCCGRKIVISRDAAMNIELIFTPLANVQWSNLLCLCRQIRPSWLLNLHLLWLSLFHCWLKFAWLLMN